MEDSSPKSSNDVVKRLSTDHAAVVDMTHELSHYVAHHDDSATPSYLKLDAKKAMTSAESFQELKKQYHDHPFNIEKACQQFDFDANFVADTMRRLLVKQDNETNNIPNEINDLVGNAGKELIRNLMGIYTTKKKGLKINRESFVSWLVSNIQTIVPKEDPKTLLVYNRMTGVWDDGSVNMIVQRLLVYYLFVYCGGGELWTMQLETVVVSLVRKLSPRISSARLDRRYRVFANGDFDSHTLTFVPHNPKHYATRRSGVVIDESAKMPKMMTFLKQILPQADTLECVRRFMGYCLTDSVAMHGFMIFLGSGANGKSVLINQLINILGPANVSAVPITKLSDEFALEPMVGKFLNVSAESDTIAVKTDSLKAVVSGDVQNVNRKNKIMIETALITKLIFSMNMSPIITESDRGLERRMHIVKFSVTIPAEQQDTSLSETLLEEASGFLNWLVAGLRPLKADGYKLTESAEMAATKKEVFLNNLPVDAFVVEMVKPGDISDGTIRSSDLYKRFKEWCVQTGRDFSRATNAKAFKNEFIDAFGRQYKKPVMYKKSSVMRFYGVSWRAK